MTDQIYDVIVIGAGPSGYAAAIYLSRGQLSTLLLGGESAGGQLMLTTEVENYPGFGRGIMGPALMEEMKNQAVKFGTEIINANVTKVQLDGEIKTVWSGETSYRAKVVIVSTGAKARTIGIGEEKYLGRGVSTCAVCDAAFFKQKKVFVVGGGDAAMEDALALCKFTDDVTLIHRRDSLRASKIMQERVLKEKGIPVLWDSEVTEVNGEAKLEKIKVRNVKTGTVEEIAADGLFLAIGHEPVTDIFKEELSLDDHGYLVTNMTRTGESDNKKIWLGGYPTETSVGGVFGAGDVVDFRYRQAITAAGMGVQAALDAEKYLTGSISCY